MKLNRPEGTLTQGFAENANPYYKGVGLKGHTGHDFVIGYNKPIKASVSGEVYSLLKARNKDGYQAIYQIVDDGDFSYEVSYGHLNDFNVKAGLYVNAGDIIGFEGNYGECYSGGVRVPLSEKDSGKGSHLHFQFRKCIRVKKTSQGKKYILTSRGKLKREGFYYEIVDYDNGYNGCIDPSPFYSVTVAQILNIVAILRRLGLIK
jgi:murein DD-endopeptidase MepM/ murein hydrolase activator NlpD